MEMVMLCFCGTPTRPKNRENVSHMALKVKSLGPTDTENLAIRIEKEVENEIVKVAKRIFKRIASNDPLFSDLESLARGYIGSKMSKGLLDYFIITYYRKQDK
jgi:hypothetical protein